MISNPASCIFDGPINGECFRAYVEQQLVPVLKPGDIVMDNLGSHKAAALRRMTRDAGARLWYLPPYSPKLNPIEQASAKIKHWMRAPDRSAPSRMLGDTSATSSLPSILANAPTTCQRRICFRQTVKRSGADWPGAREIFDPRRVLRKCPRAIRSPFLVDELLVSNHEDVTQSGNSLLSAFTGFARLVEKFQLWTCQA
jgi:transposase